MTVLVLVEHDAGAIRDGTWPTITAARCLGEVSLLVVGHDVGAVAAAAAAVPDVAAVLVADDPALADHVAEAVAPIAVALMAEHDAFVAPATSWGKNVAPRVAALLDVMQLSDVVGIDGPTTFRRPIYAGNAIATVESADPKLVLTVRATAFARAEATGGAGAPIRDRKSVV